MNVYIWERIDQLTDSYHSQGGLVVFAETESRARELALQAMRKKAYSAENHICIAESECPEVFTGVQAEERVFIFPDSGCC